MPTINQLIKKNRKKKVRRHVRPSISGRPFLRGVCKKIFIASPKKPNSANRKVARIALTTGKTVTAYVPGIGHSLQEHYSVCIKGGGAQDLPGVRYSIVRGVLDASGTIGRKRGRSLYGTRKTI